MNDNNNNNRMGQCSRRSLIEAKAHEPKPVVAIKRTNSCACAIATSNGGFLGLLFDSENYFFAINLLIFLLLFVFLPNIAEFKEAHTDSL